MFIKMRRARFFTQSILSGQSDILRFAQHEMGLPCHPEESRAWPDVLWLGMMLLPIPIKWLTILLAILILGVQTPEVMSTELRPKTVEAFDRYVQLTEARINREVSQTEKFLYLDELPPPRRSEVLAALKRGEIFMERLQTLDASGHTMEAPEAIIHHWLGAVFVPGANLPQTMLWCRTTITTRISISRRWLAHV